MLTSPQPRRRRSRQQRSLRQEYAEFLVQRIEEYKEQLSREELLAIADEAVRELEVGGQEQLVLTEVLMLEHVDRLIMRRLNLPSFRRWRTRHVRLRRAQREPTHWGLDPKLPLARLANEVDDGEALAVGSEALGAAFLLAAHDWPVVFIDDSIASVEAAETRAAAEALATRFQALVVALGTWFPDVTPALTVLDPVTLGRLKPAERMAFLRTLTQQTPAGGTHMVLPFPSGGDVTPIAPELLKTHYSGWHTERGRRNDGARWLVATKPGR